MTDKEALIERLATTCHGLDPVDPLRLLVDDVIAALAQPEQEPVAWMWDVNNGGGYTSKGIGFMQTNIPFAKHTPLYAHPPQRTEQEPDDIASIIACRNILDAQPVPPKVNT